MEVSVGESRECSGINRHRQWLPQYNTNGSATKRKDWQINGTTWN
jgi:hypothetical protein